MQKQRLEIYFDEEQNIEVIKLKTQVKGKYAFKRK